MERVVAITVTHNRTKTLEKCLESLLTQSRPIDEIIIVDNNSSTEEKENLKRLSESKKNIHVLWMKENLGGAGGFEAGMKEFQDKFPADWCWIMDDDAYPRKDCLERLLEVSKQLPNVGYLAPLIYGIDLNEYQFYHHKFLSRLIFRNIPIATSYGALNAINKIEANAFVGPLISVKAVNLVGIADGSLFIYGDDTEYTYRVSRKMDCYLVREAVIDHQDPPISANYMDTKAWWKEYYSYRNQYFMIREFQNNIIRKIVAYVMLTIPLMKLMAAAAIKPKYKGFHYFRIQLIKKAIADGLFNRRGKTLDPLVYGEMLKEKYSRRTK